MTNAETWFNNSLRPRKPEGSLGRTAQDGHLDSHTAPELCVEDVPLVELMYPVFTRTPGESYRREAALFASETPVLLLFLTEALMLLTSPMPYPWTQPAHT